MIATENFEQVEVTSAAQLHAWLEADHQQQASIWLVTYKKHVLEKCLSTQQILDEILCFGWIDGIRRKLDNDRTMQLLAPRRMQIWAKTYQDRAARLIESGRMQAAGLAAINDAKQRGLWAAWADVDALLVPDDLAAALAQIPPATTQFANLASSYRRNVLRWIRSAKTEPTRAKRIGEVARLAASGAKVPQF